MFKWVKSFFELEWVSGVKYWHKLYSFRFALLSAVCGLWSANSGQLANILPAKTFAVLSIVFALLSAFSTLIKQPKLLQRLSDEQKEE